MDDTNVFSADTIVRSDYYVYLFRNPLDEKIFYIGKGTGNRFEQFNGRNAETLKKISEIRNAGKEPTIEILRENLDEPIAKRFEGVAIDVIGIQNLTNRIHGDRGTRVRKVPDKTNLNRMKAGELEGFIDPDEAKIAEHAILIRINKLYRYGMDDDALYDVTRGVWVIGPRRECAEYAFSVFKGYIIEVYKIEKWFLAGTKATLYKTRLECNEQYICEPPRWEFAGKVAESEIREKYLKKSVKKYLSPNSQNPIKYVNC
jgi:uncharacterized protein